LHSPVHYIPSMKHMDEYPQELHLSPGFQNKK
jgi:hypothetical protein